MKQSITVILFLAFCQFIFSQKTEIENKLKDVSAKSIQVDKLVDYDLLRQAKDKIVIIEFWETWCGPCIEGMPLLKALQDKYPNDLKVICVSSDDFNKTVNFINKNKYPFDYIFDKTKELSTIFPHTGIPHTILIDKKGKIQAETLPGYLSESDIEQLISGNSIDLPLKKNFNPDDLEKVDETPSLVSFELQNTELGDRNYSTTSTSIGNKKRIVFGYTPNAYKDTVENIQKIALSGKNILELYQLAYKGLSDLRFIFPTELNYIKSNAPNDRYRLNYSISNLFGDFNVVLIRQLNAAFGLETEKIEKDTTVIVLKKIEPNDRSIILENNPNRGKSEATNIFIEEFNAQTTSSSLFEIAILLETKTHLPVEFSKTDTNKYNLNLSIKADSKASLKDWVLLFEKEGIFLVKEKRRTEFIKIKKAN